MWIICFSGVIGESSTARKETLIELFRERLVVFLVTDLGDAIILFSFFSLSNKELDKRQSPLDIILKKA